ncbi:MAG: acyl-CoA ligase (AMP-forming), exosortase A system-associated, partial [Paucibacter sp.]|nr:acyl-CoA ligase (AMP-forming), exosortase A system-associated [Roseateles sp.]
DYAQLSLQVQSAAQALMASGLARGSRIAVWLEKRSELVVACFAAAHAGMVFVPINPTLKAEQVRHILNDSGAELLLSSLPRWQLLAPGHDAQTLHLKHVWLLRPPGGEGLCGDPTPDLHLRCWDEILQHPPALAGHRVVDRDVAALLYTSGSTGKPKGVVLSHRNLLAGAQSVAQYLRNSPADVLLAALPLSFDAGFSQLTTAFLVGARVVLINPLTPRDVLNALVRHRVTGLTAVPPLYVQMASQPWPTEISQTLRYLANTGGRMPRPTLEILRKHLPQSDIFLMYGLTEAFRSTYLAPAELDRRPDSIGKAIPNAEILVLRDDGTPCDVDEPGELVHRGALVSLGYWNDAEKTAERFRPLPRACGTMPAALQLDEIAVFSGDTVKKDADGFLYFLGRRDDMIKTSGYRVSPTEIEEVVYATGLVGECAAFGLAHEALGQTVCLVACPPLGQSELDTDALMQACRNALPPYMCPAQFKVLDAPLPRNPNGKIDRKYLSDWLDGHPSAQQPLAIRH